MKRNTVLLIYPDTGENYMLNVPLCLLWVAAPLVEAGFDVKILDLRVEDDVEGVIAELADQIICVGVSSLTGSQIISAIDTSKWIKEKYPKLPIVWGGWHVSILPEQSMEESYIDYIITGQGEMPFLELVQLIQKNGAKLEFEKLDKIGNLVYQDVEKNVIKNKQRSLIDPNELPFKPYHLVDISLYEGRPMTKNDKYLVWMSSIGCPFDCSFCADPLVFKKRWLALEPKRMVDELEELVNAYGITQFGFFDDNFFISVKRAEEFADELIRREIKIKWVGTIRITGVKRMRLELLKKLKKAGLYLVHPGVEGATQEMLNYMSKREIADNIVPAAEKLAGVGIKALYSFIVGLPDEPESNVQDTFNMIEKLKNIDPNNIMPVNFYTPYPGNPLYDRSIVKGMVPPASLKEWGTFDTRMGNTPWITEEYRNEVMKRDRYYYPAALPSEVMKEKMDNGYMKFVYRFFHARAKEKLLNKDFNNDLDWVILYKYWRFWGKYGKNSRFLPNINFRWGKLA